MLKTDKVLQVKTRQGRALRLVREHYLREDVPCNSQLCLAGCRQTGSSTTPADVTHYLIPDCRVTGEFLEILELPEFTGIVFMQTVLHYVLHEKGRRFHRRLRTKVRDGRNHCAVFANEFCRYAYTPRQPGESHGDWLVRVVYDSAVWYYNHLAGQKAIVFLTQDENAIAKYGSETIGVHVMNIHQYLEVFWPTLTQAHDIYESLAASLADTTDNKKGGCKEYTEYLPSDVLAAGIKSGLYIEGMLRVNKYHAQNEAFVARGSGSKGINLDSDILIAGMKNRNRAVHGDQVAVELLPRSQWIGKINSLSSTGDPAEVSDVDQSNAKPTGRIVGVLQRHWRDYVASFPEEQESQGSRAGKVLVIPWDYRIPKIRISTRQAEALREDRIVVRLDSWETDSQYPNGHFVRSLGPTGSLETEIAAILVENSISVGAFSEGQVKELPSNSEETPWTMSEEEISQRRDLRQTHLVFSIDPKGCEDVDDTLSIRELKNGKVLELGVHIADVSYFVKPNSLTDLEAKQRSTTVYLADRRYDMLPTILSADLCSLIGGVDRYAMSVMWQLDPQTYEVRKVWYGRTVIRSSHKMFYEAAQALHDGKDVRHDIPELAGMNEDEVEKRLGELRWCIDKLMDIARSLKARRVVGGAVQLEGVEVKVELNEEQEIEDLIPKQTMEIHETIAESMIFANHWVAKKIAEAFPNCSLLRHHPLPRQDQFQDLVDSAKARGFTIDTSSNKALADSLDKCVDPKDPVYNKILRSLATKAMSNALYFSTGSLPRDQFFHYGLALDRYTHFTSPIRRYADIIVHRLLMAAITDDHGDGLSLLSNNALEELCGHINNRHRASQHAQQDSQALFQALFFKDKDPTTDECCTVDAVVHSLRANGFLIFIPRYGIKGAVSLKDKEGRVCDLSEDGKPTWTAGSVTRTAYAITATTATSQSTFSLFDHVTVRISVQSSRSHAQSLHFELISTRPHLASQLMEQGHGLRTDIVQEVTSISGEQHETPPGDMYETTDVLGSSIGQLRQEYGQTESHKSLYCLLQEFAEMGLQESEPG
ncbi:DIS3-like exonuclease 1 isoform X2 [Patiria miniata]|nr:DIS3-like exonuclease 1 isoform X2 [Patiria miniata]XP_038076854.1 DIS3-like exonuclease 1 isoform X2 [Patiria miniata]XP_038076855.1 DIS3-like exonuclease 1 isoform X2 [Patiria miniata]